MLKSLRLLALLSLTPLTLPAQDAAGWIEELRELRKTVEQQSKQIEALTQQVGRLTAALEGKPLPATAQPSPGTPNPHAPGEFEAPPAPAPKAEPVQPRHIVVKGDTFTSVAKQYGISIADLQKANKEVNERKMQIGQSLNLPPNAQLKPTPTATPEPKPNP
jgi:LysM repeat protein